MNGAIFLILSSRGRSSAVVFRQDKEKVGIRNRDELESKKPITIEVIGLSSGNTDVAAALRVQQRLSRAFNQCQQDFDIVQANGWVQ